MRKIIILVFVTFVMLGAGQLLAQTTGSSSPACQQGFGWNSVLKKCVIPYGDDGLVATPSSSCNRSQEWSPEYKRCIYPQPQGSICPGNTKWDIFRGGCRLTTETCVGEGQSLGALVPSNNNMCCKGLTPYIKPGLAGTMGICVKMIPITTTTSNPAVTTSGRASNQSETETSQAVTINASSGKVTVVGEAETTYPAYKEGYKTWVTVQAGSGDLKNVRIETRPNQGKVLLNAGGKIATTSEDVEVKGEKMFVNKKEIKIMPDTASARAIEVLGGKYTTIELKDTGFSSSSPVYEVVTYEKAKLFGVISVKVRVKANINATTGEVKIVKPWWTVFTSESSGAKN